MKLKFITGIVIIIMIIVFSVQNMSEVTLTIFTWEFSGSLSLFLILSVLLGILIGTLFTIVLRKSKKEQKQPQTEGKEPLQT